MWSQFTSAPTIFAIITVAARRRPNFTGKGTPDGTQTHSSRTALRSFFMFRGPFLEYVDVLTSYCHFACDEHREPQATIAHCTASLYNHRRCPPPALHLQHCTAVVHLISAPAPAAPAATRIIAHLHRPTACPGSAVKSRRAVFRRLLVRLHPHQLFLIPPRKSFVIVIKLL